MRAPLSWLTEYCDPGLGAVRLADRLAAGGTECERIDRVGVAALERFIVGRVLSAEPHPNADRLSVCEVDDGSGEPRTIVCGAPNVAAGQTVAVALPGAVLAGGTKLGEVELRGVASSGMILAEDELGLGEDHSGVIVLADGVAEPGTPLAEVFPISDDVLELEVSPNRPDCLGVYGVAREVHAITEAPLAEDPTATDAEAAGDDTASDHASVAIEDPDICLRFTARVFEGVEVGPSPLWLKARLAAVGQRPISNVVDITNYVMLVTGQPLHAFDLDKVRGGEIRVRCATEGERMTTLDGVDRGFDAETVLVCDAEGPSGIAGIMGGQVSEVSGATTRVLMEAATWVGPNILRSSGKLGLRSEASGRFEKQLHPEQAIAAQRLASKLMVEACGARLVPGTLDEYPDPQAANTVKARPERLRRLVGVEVPAPEMEAILGRLGFEPIAAGKAADELEVSVPYWRDGDVRREADVIEEVVRIHGLDRLPATLPARGAAVGRLTPAQRLRRRLEDALRDRGLNEVVAYSFTSPAAIERLRLGGEPLLQIANPLSEDQSVMRPLLLPGLLDAAARNTAHGRTDLALFESARVHCPDGELVAPEGSPHGREPARESHRLGALLTQAAPGGWRSEARAADFYAARALVEALLEVAGVEWTVAPGARPYLHPGRSAEIVDADGKCLGWAGEIHPLIARGWELEGAAALELDLDAVIALAGDEGVFAAPSSFPAVLQDIAVTVPDEVTTAEVESAIRAGGGDLLQRLSVFDVYRGEQVGEGNRSLALRLEFRASDRTLAEGEVATLRDAIAAKLGAIGGALRG